MLSFGEDEFANFHLGAGEGKFRQQHVGEFHGKGFDQAAGTRAGDGRDAAGGEVVIRRMDNVILKIGKSDSGRESCINEETLGAASFLIGDADAAFDGKAFDDDFVHVRRFLYKVEG